ncbi:MAG TPA: alpha/beta hydrolase [Candidatus Omnitrophota bacterium]|nr:alpha/beta hydrolase [Candidatus Omnitrophota bacterium]
MFSDKLVAASSGRFAVRDFGGEGRDVLLVHGTGHNLEVWGPVAALLRQRFHAVAFDMRGHGQTPVNSKDAEEYWRDIGAVSAALGLRFPVLVGHSAGGYAVTAFAASGGECAGVVIVDGFVLDGRETPEGAHAWDIPEQQLWDMFRYGWKTDQESVEGYVRDVCAAAERDWLNKGVPPDLIAKFTRRSFFRNGDQWLRRPTMEEIRTAGRPDPGKLIYPSVDIYAKIRVPMGFIFAKDGLYKGRKQEVQVLSVQGQGRIFLEVDCGHNVPMLCPGAVAGMVEKIASLPAF